MPQSPQNPAFQPARPLKLPRTARTVTALILREMSTTYGRSALGYLWAVLEPAAGIMLLTFIFSLAFRSPELGTNYPLFFASGMLPFMVFQDISQKTSVALRFSRALLFYPGVTFIDALLARIILNVMTQIMVSAIVLCGILQFYQVDVLIDAPSIALGYAMAISLGIGIGTLNCFLLSLYPIWERTWAILTRPLFIISTVLFLFDSVPLPYRDWLWYNPLIHAVAATRQGIYATYDANFVSPTYTFAIAAITLMAGLLMLRKYNKKIINI